MATKKSVLYLFDRPSEPVFVSKGDTNVRFEIPTEYLADRYQPLATDIFNRFGEETGELIKVSRISVPDITPLLELGRRDNFSLFIPRHRKLAARLIDIFMGMRTYDDFLSAAVYCRDRLNPNMFIYALSVAILHRPDTRNLEVPPLSEVFPDKYMDSAVFARAKEESNVVSSGSRMPLVIPQDYTATDLEIEHRVAYFREDVGINLHHWHWHLVYPFNAALNIVNKDRRGELFFYMHQQIMGRYNFERFCNRLGRTKRLLNLREPISEGYFPKLDSLVAGRVWPARHSNATLSDVFREQEQLKFDLHDLERWRDRIYDAIHKGEVVNDRGQTLVLNEEKGIDILGNIIESSILTPNATFYGDMHNLGHVAIALCHDPDHRHLETFGVIGDPATAMRDPVFYRWHAFIDDIFQEHKNTMPRYTVDQLNFNNVRVTAVEVVTRGSKTKNEFLTFWQQDDVDLSRGLDFTPRGSVFARFTHLQHTPFNYRIQVENNSNQQRIGTVRIFLAPKFDERGLPMLFLDQKVKPKTNLIERRSEESSVTIPFERTFRNLETGRPTVAGDAMEQFNYCGCGWPQHMLLPKGNAEGFPSQLFVMVSDYEGDKASINQQNDGACADASSYCGIRDKLYPDKRSMDYPFDRQPRENVNTTQQFLTPNMMLQDVTIRFSNRIETPKTASEYYNLYDEMSQIILSGTQT
uniref:Tyrosinase copper-binding domain-containing protein n=1 Tax=Timema monikensis TaxID=170555 RepID=A0A7R9HR45_9NEOP|nr:unnamed protein product [Timema monikensis]